MDIGKCQNMSKWSRSEESSRGWSFEWSWHELTRCSRRWGTNFLARAPRTWAQISSNLLSSYGLLQCIKFEEFIDISTCVSKKIYLELSWHNLDSSRPHLYSLDSCVRICPNAVCLVCQGTKQACLAWSFVHLSTWERLELTIDKLCWLMTLGHAMFCAPCNPCALAASCRLHTS
jgi:hypothetical protein